jgi:SOS regulatory protein LexA
MRKPNRDDEHLQSLRDYFASNRRIPSLQRIASLLGFSSRSAAVKLMGRLADEGFIERTVDDDAWIPGRRFFERNMIETSVPAGVPVTAIDVESQPLLFDEFLVKKPNETFVIPIKGDSMIEAGIYDGDLAVVEKTNSAKVGAFVIANVDNEFTLKELVKEGGKYALKPHNSRLPMIYPEGKLQVEGVLVGLVRKYRN